MYTYVCMYALFNDVISSFTNSLSWHSFIFTAKLTLYCWPSWNSDTDELEDKNPWEKTHTEPPQALVGDPKLRHGLAAAVHVSINHNPLQVRRGVNNQKQSSLCKRLEQRLNNLLAAGG